MEKQWKQCQTLFFVWFSKIIADGDCSHVIKRCLPLGRKVMTNLDRIFREGNGNPLQYSCLENPVDRGSWWAAVYRVTQSRTWLKWPSMYACIGEGNGSPLQYSCLENPRDRGAWWATVYRVVQSRTWLKRPSSSSRKHIQKQRHYFAN